jgi:hypothetical protein
MQEIASDSSCDLQATDAADMRGVFGPITAMHVTRSLQKLPLTILPAYTTKLLLEDFACKPAESLALGWSRDAAQSQQKVRILTLSTLGADLKLLLAPKNTLRPVCNVCEPRKAMLLLLNRFAGNLLMSTAANGLETLLR